MQNTCEAFRISYSAEFKGVETLEIFNLSIEYTVTKSPAAKTYWFGHKLCRLFSPSNIISFYFQAFGLIIISSEYADVISSDYVYLCNESWSLGVFGNETTC